MFLLLFSSLLSSHLSPFSQVVVNLEVGGASDADDATNPDRSLMRFEFVDAGEFACFFFYHLSFMRLAVSQFSAWPSPSIYW